MNLYSASNCGRIRISSVHSFNIGHVDSLFVAKESANFQTDVYMILTNLDYQQAFYKVFYEHFGYMKEFRSLQNLQANDFSFTVQIENQVANLNGRGIRSSLGDDIYNIFYEVIVILPFLSIICFYHSIHTIFSNPSHPITGKCGNDIQTLCIYSQDNI